MDHTGRPDDAHLGDGAVARPDTIGVGWPTASPTDDADRRSRSLWGVLLVVGAVVWVPVSLLLTLAGAVAVAGWGNEDGSKTTGLVDEVTVDTVSGALFVVLVASLAALLLGWLSRAVTGCSVRRGATAGIVLALWAPVAAIVVVALLVAFD